MGAPAGLLPEPRLLPERVSDSAPTLLGVEASVTGRAWRPRLADERRAYELAQAHGLPDLLARILAGRGVTLANAAQVLAPSLRTALPDPNVLRDMERATARLVRAIQQNETVAVFGDYDVDGGTSSALLKRFFESIGASLVTYIPDRLAEGYGPNGPAFDRLKAQSVSLVVTVDCGTQAFAALAHAQAIGLEIIVVDHHQAGPELPPAHAVLNPHRLDDTSDLTELAAVGVTFLLVVAVSRALREAGWFEGRGAPDLLALLDLVALGTVADVVPLTGLNRVFVTQGLKIMARTSNVGLRELAAVARLDRAPEAYHLGFLLGPRVNAGGRVGASDLGVKLLTCDDPVEARRLALVLDKHNLERQAIEAMVLEDAIARIERGEGRASETGPIVIGGNGWHPGVVGIVASRLKERYQRPAIVVGFLGETGRGSGRSIPGVDLGRAVRGAADDGLLLNGGGHAMAAGLSVARGGVDALLADLDRRLAVPIAAALAAPCLKLDSVIGTLGDGAALADLIARGAPYGAGFPEPHFAFPDMRVAYADVVGENHIRMTLEDGGGGCLKGIAFRVVGTPLGDALLRARGSRLHLAGRLKPDNRSRMLELHIEDAAVPV